MNDKRLTMMNQYKVELDSKWHEHHSNYANTLLEAKLVGFRVLRNSAGDHKLEDTPGVEKEKNMFDVLIRHLEN